jgi:hypothetical protein
VSVSFGAVTVVTKLPAGSVVTSPNTPPPMDTLLDAKNPLPAIVTFAVERSVFR